MHPPDARPLGIRVLDPPEGTEMTVGVTSTEKDNKGYTLHATTPTGANPKAG